MPTEQELRMIFLVTLGLVHTIVHPKVELIKRELAGEKSIIREFREVQPHFEALHDQPGATDLDIIYGGVGGDSVVGEVVDVGASHVDAGSRYGDEHVADAQQDDSFQLTLFSGPTQPSSSSYFLCKYKNYIDR